MRFREHANHVLSPRFENIIFLYLYKWVYGKGLNCSQENILHQKGRAQWSNGIQGIHTVSCLVSPLLWRVFLSK